MTAAGARSIWAAWPFLPVLIAVWRKIWSPQTIGVDVPLPGISTFHLTFLVSPHCVGGLAVGAAVPLPEGPRHCGQFPSAPAGSAARAADDPPSIAAPSENA